ncbi:acyl transferase domain-containing protein/acyl carrier protein [Paenibacillus sp. 4624]|uniref:SDR family NAD(P)-dependent oxidoreductase n=1 Tax=Paenibacillus amylolyticus TaxID=1451 RepID=A0A5M9WTW0_PAEAM|nr:SDR family NAD(P)-dependent oxidoreductase [Paenibacillus amylolyticus]KAA8785066.1 SDR family NAD(P)-dependent oxidoreductase [Paenibacillus amylolyticus]
MKKLFQEDNQASFEVYESESSLQQEPIAVIGMAGRFPLANNLEQFWSNLTVGMDCITSIPDSRKKTIERYFQLKNMPLDDAAYARMAYLNQIDLFDSEFFNISPQEANLMDPNQRIFLETAWTAFEDAGYGVERLRGSKTGIYVGYSNEGTKYKELIEDFEPESLPVATPGNLQAIIASRISYLMDLRGPSMLIDTTCSSSLVAIHTACQEIRNAECDMAIAGSVKIHLTPIESDAKIGIESSDSRTRTFDNLSDGIGLGEGVAAVVLKPLRRAIQDGDRIYAVVKGSAKNQDGASMGITAPNLEAQADVITSAWAFSGVVPETISYIEAHGTGTKLGDPIEIAAIEQAFRRYTSRKQFCAVGSIKSNMGHLDTAAGIAGFVKAVLMLQNKVLIPTCHFQRPNRKVEFEGSPVYVNDRFMPWEPIGTLRRCGISSFGLSGTNCHMVLEEYVSDAAQTEKDNQMHLIALSAKSKKALMESIALYIDMLQEDNNISINNLCYTANATREHYSHRYFVIFRNQTELESCLRSALAHDLQLTAGELSRYSEHKLGSVRGTADSTHISEEELHRISKEADQLIAQLVKTGKADPSKLFDLGLLYVRGAKVKWRELQKGKGTRTVNAPTYPFQRKRHWLRSMDAVQSNWAAQTGYYQVKWVKEHRLGRNAVHRGGCILILGQPEMMRDRLAGEVAKLLRRAGLDVVEGVVAERNESYGNGSYGFMDTDAGYLYLLQQIGEKSIDQIIHLGGWYERTSSAQLLSEPDLSGLNSLFRLVQALVVAERKQLMDVVLITKQANRVTGTENVTPEHSSYIVFGKTVGQEHLNIRCRSLDIDDLYNIADIISELSYKGSTYSVAYRNGERFIQRIEAAAFVPAQKQILKDGGVYLITGGLGDVALEVATWAAKQKKVRLLLVNRSSLQEAGTDSSTRLERIKTKRSKIQEIEGLGSQVHLFQFDIADSQALSEHYSQWREQFGKVDGVFHCAGVAAPSLIQDRQLLEAEEVLRPKVQGTWALKRVLSQEPLDFMVLFSSVASLMGLYGNSDYAAANAYLDAVASQEGDASGQVISISWPAWKDIGMGRALDNEGEHLFSPILPVQAIAAMEHALSSYRGQVIIGSMNMTHPLLTHHDLAPIEVSVEVQGAGKRKPDASVAPARQTVLSGSAQGYSDTEKQIAKIFTDVLGIEEISIHDHFYEIGGNSLLAVEFINQMERSYPGMMDIADLYSYPSIARIAEHIDGKSNKEQEGKEDPLDLLLDGLEDGSLTFDEALDLFSKGD